MDMACVQATGQESLWPIFDAWDQLAEWLDMDDITGAYQAVMASKEDIRPLRKLQSVQTLAYRLLDRSAIDKEIVDDPGNPVLKCI